MSMGEAPRIAEVHKRLFLPGGGHVVVRSEQPQARPQVQMIPYTRAAPADDALRRPKRLLAYCCMCKRTSFDLPNHLHQFKEHRVAIRYVLVPDLRATA